MGGPIRTPQTKMDTPKTTHFSLASSIVGNIRKPWPKFQNQSLLFATYLICHQGSQIPHLGRWGAHLTPQKILDTLKSKTTPFWAAAPIGDEVL